MFDFPAQTVHTITNRAKRTKHFEFTILNSLLILSAPLNLGRLMLFVLLLFFLHVMLVGLLLLVLLFVFLAALVAQVSTFRASFVQGRTPALAAIAL